MLRARTRNAQARPPGGIGRRGGLKTRWPERVVPVRARRGPPVLVACERVSIDQLPRCAGTANCAARPILQTRRAPFASDSGCNKK
jgi:hypothetical protein